MNLRVGLLENGGGSAGSVGAGAWNNGKADPLAQ